RSRSRGASRRAPTTARSGPGPDRTITGPRARAPARAAGTRRGRRDPRADVARGLPPARRGPGVDAGALPAVARGDPHATADLSGRGAEQGDDPALLLLRGFRAGTAPP